MKTMAEHSLASHEKAGHRRAWSTEMCGEQAGQMDCVVFLLGWNRLSALAPAERPEAVGYASVHEAAMSREHSGIGDTRLTGDAAATKPAWPQGVKGPEEWAALRATAPKPVK